MKLKIGRWVYKQHHNNERLPDLSGEEIIRIVNDIRDGGVMVYEMAEAALLTGYPLKKTCDDYYLTSDFKYIVEVMPGVPPDTRFPQGKLPRVAAILSVLPQVQVQFADDYNYAINEDDVLIIEGDRMNTDTPTRVVCNNPNLRSHGLFGTVVGGEHSDSVEPGNLVDVVWLDYPDEGSDEIDGSNLQVVTEVTYQIEVAERKLDN